MTSNCAFCDIVAGTAPATIVHRWPDAIAIRPRSGGVNPSHVVIIPRAHIADAGEDPAVAAVVMYRASLVMATMTAANFITSKGAAATQTVFHLHGHVAERWEGDGLPLLWTPQHEARAAVAAAVAAATGQAPGRQGAGGAGDMRLAVAA